MGKAFAQEKGLGEFEEYFAKGAVVAQDPLIFESLTLIDDDDKRALRREVTHKWDQPKQMVSATLSVSERGSEQPTDNLANPHHSTSSS